MKQLVNKIFNKFDFKRVFFLVRIWFNLSKKSYQIILQQKSVALLFLIGKLIRLGLLYIFILTIMNSAKSLAGYDKNQVLFFFFTFVFIDALSQFFFRSVYTFRQLLVSGDFDLILTTPISPLFRVLLGGSDLIDLLTIPLIAVLTFYYAMLLNPGFLEILYFIILLINGVIVSAGFYIIVLGLAIITLEIDHIVMIFRDISSMARFPVDIYKEPIKSLLTFILPVAIIFTIPAKSLMGLLSFWGVASSVLFGVSFLFLGLFFWKIALRKYTSASS